MDHDRYVIRVFEGQHAAIERGVIEVPLRRSELPNQLGKIMPIFIVAGPAPFGGEIELIPPFEFGLRRQGKLAGFLAADQIRPNHVWYLWLRNPTSRGQGHLRPCGVMPAWP
jgi:hypothetical protein